MCITFMKSERVYMYVFIFLFCLDCDGVLWSWLSVRHNEITQ